MSDETKGGAPRKLSTQEILAAARAQKPGGAAPAKLPEPAAEPETAAAAEPAPAEASPPKPAVKPAGVKPKSTADILAAARAQAAGGGAAPAAASPAAGRPKSTADILAAARAGKAGAASAAPAGNAEKPAAKAVPKAPAAEAVPAADGSPKLSVEEMLAAVRPGAAVGPAAAAVVAPKPAKPAGPPPMPAKPAPAAKKAAAASEPRRNILIALVISPFALAWMLMVATTTVFALATARFMLPNVLTEPPRKFKIGPPSDYDLGTVATKLVAQYGVWIVHTDQYKGKNLIYALASVCTHLGCTPSWLEGEQKFKCPCHGSGFYITGINFEGPAPRPLERMGIRLAPDGMLEVDKSLKFQEEMGQWADPASFYEVVA